MLTRTLFLFLSVFCLGIHIISAQSKIHGKEEREKVILMACGSFNPPTMMHLRMFEIARDHLRETENVDVIGGIMSAAHVSYKKRNTELISNKDRHELVRLSLLSSDWIRQSDWEMRQDQWTPTVIVLRYHQEHLNSILNDEYGFQNVTSWLPQNINDFKGKKVQIKYLVGADVLEQLSGVSLCADKQLATSWSKEEVETILLNYGLVTVARFDYNQHQLIFDSDLLSKHKANITIIENWVKIDLSSSLIRTHLRRG